MLNYNQPCVDDDDIRAVTEVLHTTMLTQGSKVPEFERALMAYCDADYAVTVSSGTAALHLACMSLGITQGDTVWTVSNSFVASANCARYCGAEVEFVDIDASTGMMSVEALQQKLRQMSDDQRPKALVVVDYAGECAELADIRQLSQQYGFFIIQDASHSLGAEYQQAKVGACQYSDITTFSFHPIKTITTGEGGAILTNNPQWAERARILRTHGIQKTDSQYPWSYSQQTLGMNYRLSDIQAALGISQLKKIDEFVARRRTIVQRYQSHLNNGVNGRGTRVLGSPQSSCHLAPLLIEHADLDDLTAIFQFFLEHNIRLQKHYIPIHTQPYYQGSTASNALPKTDAFYRQQISLPVYVGLTDAEVDHIAGLVTQCLAGLPNHAAE